jgi:hypothetical protein
MKEQHYDNSKYAWPGGYTYIWYFNDMNETICTCYDCAQKKLNNSESEYKFIGQDVHWEGESLWCDDCGVEMESEYGIPEKE